MRISLLSLKNWGPFRGEHRLDLDAKAYAVVARRSDDPDSSNGAGKTMLVQAIEFALYGQHRFRTEDEFITRGEGECSVAVHFDDGTMVGRTRQRGKSTRLQWVDANGNSAAQDGAQQEILKRVGLDADDYRNTAYLAQKQAHRLVTARPEERMTIVGGWLGLDRLEACADSVRAQMSALSHRSSQHAGLLRAAEDMAARALGDCADLGALQAKEVDVASKIEALRGELADMQAKLAEVEQAKLAQERAHELGVVTVDGKRLKAERDAMNPGQLEREAERSTVDARMATTALSEARRELEQKRVLAKGKFDGHCPVAGIACPATDKINVMGLANQKMAHEAADRADEAARRQADAFAAERSATAAFQAVQRIDTRLESLREQARRLKALAGPGTPGPDPGEASAVRTGISALQDRLGALSAERGAVLRAVTDYQHAQGAIQEARDGMRALEVELSAHRAAAQVFGRNGAQRRVAEGALSQIEVGANELLSGCGADLRVAVSWAREGAGLSKACEACGAPFPASAKVKACERCGTARGPHLVQKLEVELSDRSGGLEDLAGFALQLSAWRWLKEARGSAWGVLVADEPVAAFDRTLKRAFASHLARMLAAGGIEQSFVVAHDSSVLETLPGKILVTSDGGFAKVEVIA